MTSKLSSLRALPVVTHLLNELTADPSLVNTPRQVLNAHYSLVAPTPLIAPSVISLNAAMLDVLNVQCDASDALKIVVGEESMGKSWALGYGGHQFRSWAGQLGDGRAISIAQVLDRSASIQELQLKGAGLTPYSR